MPARRELAILAQVNRHCEAPITGVTSRLVCLDALATGNIPDMDTTIVGRAGEVVLISAQRNRPGFTAACLSRRDRPPQCPFCVAIARIIRAAPDFNIAFEADAGCDITWATARCANMVAAKPVSVLNLLLQREGWIGCAVNSQSCRAAGRNKRSLRRGD